MIFWGQVVKSIKPTVVVIASGLLLSFFFESANATLVDFSELINISAPEAFSNGEVDGTEWIDQGLLITTPNLALNVGCRSRVSACLGADLISPSDFQGTILGTAVVPGSTIQAAWDFLEIDFCCVDGPTRFTTTTSVFDVKGNLIALFVDTDVSFYSDRGIGSFSTDLGSDAMNSVIFSPLPEPNALHFLAMGLAGVLWSRRRSQIYR